MAIKTLLIRFGDKHEIRAIAFPTDDDKWDKCEILSFLQEQAETRPEEATKLGTLLSESASNGPPKNEQKFKHLKDADGICEFKTFGGLRLLCFFDDSKLIICTHGFVKGGQKTPPNEIARSKKLKKQYFQAKTDGTLIHVPTKK